MIPTHEQIERIDGTLALLMDGLNLTIPDPDETGKSPGEERVSEEALARALAVSLGRRSRGGELRKLLRGAQEALKLSLTVV